MLPDIWTQVDRAVSAPPPPDDLLAALNSIFEQIAACKRHPRAIEDAYGKVWLGLEDAANGILDALNGWPA